MSSHLSDAAYGLYISALEHAIMLILIFRVLLASMIVTFINIVTVQFREHAYRNIQGNL